MKLNSRKQETPEAKALKQLGQLKLPEGTLVIPHGGATRVQDATPLFIGSGGLAPEVFPGNLKKHAELTRVLVEHYEALQGKVLVVGAGGKVQINQSVSRSMETRRLQGQSLVQDVLAGVKQVGAVPPPPDCPAAPTTPESRQAPHPWSHVPLAEKKYIQSLEHLWDMVRDMVESGRLSEATAPDDFQAIVQKLEVLPEIEHEITRDWRNKGPVSEGTLEVQLVDQADPDGTPLAARVQAQGGQLYVYVPGYGANGTVGGAPVALEIWEGHLRALVWEYIGKEDPTILDLEGARETLEGACE